MVQLNERRELEDMFSFIAGEIIWLNEKSDFYDALFYKSAERFDLIKDCAPVEFRYFQEYLRDDIFLSICRLLDPPRSVGKENCNIKMLLEVLPDIDPETRLRIDDTLSSLKSESEEIRNHRNKWLSHRDLQVATQTQQLPTIQHDTVEKILKLFLDLFYILHEIIYQHEAPLYQSPPWSSGNSLIETLKYAKEYEELCNRGKIENPFELTNEYKNI